MFKVINSITGTPLNNRRYENEDAAYAAIERARKTAALRGTIGWTVVPA